MAFKKAAGGSEEITDKCTVYDRNAENCEQWSVTGAT